MDQDEQCLMIRNEEEEVSGDNQNGVTEKCVCLEINDKKDYNL